MPIKNNNPSRLGIAGFIDVETTGLSPAADEVVELALWLFEFHRSSGEIMRIVDTYTELREPSRPIPRAASRIHGIYWDDVVGKQLDTFRVEAMLQKAEFLVAHNAGFDRSFVTRLFPCCLDKPWLCSMRGINWKGRGYPSAALQRLLEAHRIQVEQAHRADADVQGALRLLSHTDREGKRYFLELLEHYSAV